MKADFPTATQIPALRVLWKEAFGDSDALLDNFFKAGFSPERCRCMFAEGQAAAALYWFDCSCDSRPFAYIYAVATAKAHRGRGLCRALMADTHAHLKELGYRGCILVPGEKGLFTMYKKMGYTCFSGMDTIHCEAAAEVPMRKISARQYTALRKQYLPHHGVEQQGTEFLASYAQLYAGNDFLLAWADGLGLELLGNTAAAPGILATLGKKEGSFRIPGSQPFAMWHPLSDVPEPGYFGIAFD